MKMVTLAGPPSTGKTAVLLHTIGLLGLPRERIAVVKFDCLTSDDAHAYAESGVVSFAAFSAGQCPDHFFASNAADVFDWGVHKGMDLLITESAGLCNRCSPYVQGVPAICVIDCLAGIGAPKKIGPLLKLADLIVLTKGDVVSQAEREVFAYRVQAMAPKATVVTANGLTGQGVLRIARFIDESNDLDGLAERELRFSTPSALCSYCLGETKLGEEHRMGNVRKIDLP